MELDTNNKQSIKMKYLYIFYYLSFRSLDIISLMCGVHIR